MELPDTDEPQRKPNDHAGQTGRVHRVAAPEVVLVDGEDDEGQTGENPDRIDPVAGVPDVVVADPLAGEDLVEEAVALVAGVVGLGVDGEIVELADLDLVNDELREAELGALENEEGPERHDEARERCSVDERSRSTNRVQGRRAARSEGRPRD